jgi:hypothetical protein
MDKLANQYQEETKHMNLPPQQIISDQGWKSQEIHSTQSDDT